MTTALHRPTALTTHALVARLLDEPALAAQVAALEPPALGALIRAVGLEDAGELVALATTAQLVAVFDEDLWQGDERFDAARFVIWLEVMMEAGDAAVARQLAALPEDLVALALHEQLWVLDVDGLREELDALDADEVGRVDKALASSLSEEIDGYQLVSRRPDGWDTVLAAVLALDRDHRPLLVRLLDRLIVMSQDAIEDEGGLHAALTAEETLAVDAAAERADRRAAIGHIAARDAAAFLALAAKDGEPARDPITRARDGEPARDPITRAYFRELAPLPPTSHDAGALRALLAQLDDDAPADHRRALPATTGEPAVLAALRALAADEPARATERQRELAYLANVLVAGAGFGAGRARRPVRPLEAAHAAVAVVDRGLALAAASEHASPRAIVETHGADHLFRLGWAALHRAAAQRGRTFAAGDLDILDAMGRNP